jgi:hypothetical protein
MKVILRTGGWQCTETTSIQLIRGREGHEPTSLNVQAKKDRKIVEKSTGFGVRRAASLFRHGVPRHVLQGGESLCRIGVVGC